MLAIYREYRLQYTPKAPGEGSRPMQAASGSLEWQGGWSPPFQMHGRSLVDMGPGLLLHVGHLKGQILRGRETVQAAPLLWFEAVLSSPSNPSLPRAQH